MDTPSPADLGPPPAQNFPMHERPPRRDFGYSPFLPLLLLLIAAVGWSGFQCWQLGIEKNALAALQANQAKPHEDATKLRTALDGIARETSALADKGNPNAKLIVNELARRGITIYPNPPAAAAAPEKK